MPQQEAEIRSDGKTKADDTENRQKRWMKGQGFKVGQQAMATKSMAMPNPTAREMGSVADRTATGMPEAPPQHSGPAVSCCRIHTVHAAA